MMRSILRLGVTAVALAWTPGLVAQAQDVIKIGIPTGLRALTAWSHPRSSQSAELAVDEINAAGGILGKKVMLEVADDGSGAAGAQKAADLLIFQKKVNVLISMQTSAARNGMLPIVTRGKVPYIYTSLYEGRSCNKYLYANGAIPDRWWARSSITSWTSLRPRTSSWSAATMHLGAECWLSPKPTSRRRVASRWRRYQPMDATDWTAIISKMRSANPDAVIFSTAGGAPNVTLQKQYKAAGMKAHVAI